MIWGCMTWERVGYAAKIGGRVDNDLYLQILKDELLNSLEHYGLNPPDIILQQGNDPKYTSKKVKKWLGEQEFRTMVWPAQSPDLNPLNISGVICKEGLQSMKIPLVGFMSCEKGSGGLGEDSCFRVSETY